MEETPKPPSEELKPEPDPVRESEHESDESVQDSQASTPETSTAETPRDITRPKPIGESMTWVSMFFGFLAVIGFFLLGKMSYQKWLETRPQITEPTPHPFSTVPVLQSIGEFSVILKSEQVLRVEVVFQCYEQETCDYIKLNRLQVRDLISPILVSLSTESISDLEMKKNLRKKLVSRVNTLKMPGKVFQSFITNLSIEGSTYGNENP